MSRSIHTTRQQLSEARRRQYADEGKRTEIVKRLQRELRQKYWIKHQMRQEAARTRQPQVLAVANDGTPILLETLPIEIEAGGDPLYVHHAASPDDLRALLAVLPPGMADGLSRIVLTWGRSDLARRAKPDEGKPDPLTGRKGWEVFSGVYGGVFLGTYRPRTTSIWLYAYVYDAGNLPLPLSLCELFLRLRTLTTFAHELAHHFDEMRRVARGRWLARGRNRVERYAEAWEHAWGQEFVVPLLRQRYSEQVRALEAWIEHHGGAKVPLELLAGDPRTTRRDHLITLQTDIRAAFESWLAVMHKYPATLFGSRLAFAGELHLADDYNRCLQVVDGLLSHWPPTPEVWTLKADTLVHLRRFDEAECCALEALAMDASSLKAWEQLGWVSEGRCQWPELLANTDKRLGLIDRDKERHVLHGIMLHRAVAYCGLGDTRQMDACLLEVIRPSYVDAWRKIVHRRAGINLPEQPSQP